MAKKKLSKKLDLIALILVVVGAINWGLVGISANLDLVKLIFRADILVKIVYILVGLSGVYMIKQIKLSVK